MVSAKSKRARHAAFDVRGVVGAYEARRREAERAELAAMKGRPEAGGAHGDETAGSAAEPRRGRLNVHAIYASRQERTLR